MAEPAPTPELVGPFRILGELGRGGQGAVYLAEDTRFPRRVALKVLSPAFSASPEMLARFRREAEVAARLAHPGICTVYEASFEGQAPWIAMRYVEGESLARRIEKERGHAPGGAPRRAKTTTGVRLPGPAPAEHGIRAEVAQILLLFEKAARAMDAAHEAGLVHRDLKPANVMVTPEGEPVILDFGLAHVDDIGGGGARITQTGQLMGTPAYMAPEQLAASRIPLDRRTDVYSLAATLYECLTLRPAHAAPTLEKLFHRILFAPVEEVSRYNPHVPGDLAIVLDTALEKDRDRRYRTALEFAEDLRRVRTLEPIHARPAGPLLRLGRWARRNRLLAASLLSLFVVLSAGLAASLSLLASTRRERDALAHVGVERDEKVRALARAEKAKSDAERSAAEARAFSQEKQQALDEKEGALGEKDAALKRAQTALADATAAREAKEKASERSRALALVGASKVEGEDDPMLGLLLAREAVRAAETTETVSRLHEAVQQSLERKVFTNPGRGALLDVRTCADADLVLAASNDGTARLLNFDGSTKVVFRGHSGPVNMAVFSPDGTLIVTASDDGTARVWTLDGKQKAVVEPKGGPLSRALLSADGRHVFTHDSADIARVSDLAGKEILAVNLPERVPSVFAPAGDRVAVQLEAEVVVWSPGAKEPVRIAGGASRAVFSPDGRLLVLLVSEGLDVRTIDGQRVCLITNGPSRYSDCTIGFARDGSFVYAIGPEKISSWELPSGRARPPAPLPRAQLAGVNLSSISPAGDLHLSLPFRDTRETGQDVLVRGIGGDQVGRLVVPSSTRSVAFGGTGDRILACTSATLHVSELFGRELAAYSAIYAPFDRLVQGEAAFSPSGDRIAFQFTGQISVWDRNGLPVVITGADNASSIRWCDAERLVTSNGHETLLWRLTGPAARYERWVRARPGAVEACPVVQAQLLRRIEGPDDQVAFMAVSPGGDRILAPGKEQGTLVLLDAADGAERFTYRVGTHVYNSAFLPGDRGVILSYLPPGGDLAVHVFDLEGKPGAQWPFPPSSYWVVPTHLAVSGDGRRVLLVMNSGLHVWDLTTNSTKSTERGPDIEIAVFSPAGDRIVYASGNTATVVASDSLKPIAALKGHKAGIACAAFSPDGSRIVTGAYDRTARIWDAADGREIATLRAHTAPVTWVGFSPAGDAILTSSGGTAHLWASRAEDLLALADARITRPFTADEKDRFEDLLGEKTRAEMTARSKVDALFTVHVATAEVMKRLQADRQLAPLEKEAALSIARERGDDPERLLEGWLARGEDRVEQMAFDEALAAFRKAEPLADPEDRDAHYRIHVGSGVALEKMGSDEEALHEYRKALMLQGNAEIGRAAVELALRTGRYDWAELGTSFARASAGKGAPPEFLEWCDRPRRYSELRRTSPRVPVLVVEYVTEDSESERAGVRKGDLLLRVAGRDVDDTAQVNSIWSGLEDESSCALVMYRDGKEIELQAKAGTLGLTLFRIVPAP